MIRLKELLNKPFPQEESFPETFRMVTIISLFVMMFLYVFKPFGLSTQGSGLFLLCLGFGVTTFVTSLACEFVVVRVLKIKGEGANFTFGRWILYLIGVMLFISLANFLFMRIALLEGIQWSQFLIMLRSTFAIGLLPIIAIGALALFRQERKYQTIAHEFNRYNTPAADVVNSRRIIVFEIPVRQIRYIQAMQNYIKIGYVDSNGNVKEQVQRATLKSLSERSLGESLLRCHRSFFVNLDSIRSVSGNAQGLTLSLLDCDKLIPVSRNYVPVFKSKRGF